MIEKDKEVLLMMKWIIGIGATATAVAVGIIIKRNVNKCKESGVLLRFLSCFLKTQTKL